MSCIEEGYTKQGKQPDGSYSLDDEKALDAEHEELTEAFSQLCGTDG